jgi:membrane protein DedA with SNARE-associated domain
MGQSLPHPLLLMAMLALITLLVEDAALAAGVALAGAGGLSWPAAFLAVAIGIAVGDLMLYGLGWGARRLPHLRERLDGGGKRLERAERLLCNRLGLAMALARIVPGLRVVIYGGAGLLATPLPRFAGWVVLCVTVWTGGVFWLASGAGALLTGWAGLPVWPAALLLFSIMIAGSLLLNRLGQRLLTGKGS